MIDKPNYTQIPNIILDDFIMCMGDAEFKVVLAIARQTFGYHRARHKISLAELRALTGLSRQGVINGVAAGMERGVIDREADGDSWSYAIVINDSASQRNGLVHEVDQPASPRSRPPVVHEVDQASPRNGLEVVHEVDQYTPVLKKELKKDLKKGERKREAAQPPAPRPRRKQANVFKSPYVDNRRFELGTGRIRPGTGTTPVEVYYERFSMNDPDATLNAIKEDDLALGCKDLDRLREVVTAYSQTNYRPGNLKLILDWYRDGIPDKHKAPTGQTKGMSSLQRLAASNGVAL